MIAVHYAREGADCVIVHLKESQQLVEAEGRRLVLKGDVAAPSFCREIVIR